MALPEGVNRVLRAYWYRGLVVSLQSFGRRFSTRGSERFGRSSTRCEPITRNNAAHAAVKLTRHGAAFATTPTRLSAELHRKVCLVLTEDAVLAEELLARKRLGDQIVGRLSDRALLVRPGQLDVVLDELKKMGHTPQVVGK